MLTTISIFRLTGQDLEWHPLAVALVKRQKKPKLPPQLPARQVICRNCGAPLFVDDSPGGEIPPYCCLACKSSWPPSREESESRAKRQAEHSLRMQERSREVRVRLERGLPVIWVPTMKLTANQKRKIKIQARMDEILAKPPDKLSKGEWKWLAKVWQFLTRGSRSGRKKKSRYDEWRIKEARANLHGFRRPTLRELAGKSLPESRDPSASTAFKDEMDRLRDAFKKARKRRQLPFPPTR